jgi:hypothetical protein
MIVSRLRGCGGGEELRNLVNQVVQHRFQRFHAVSVACRELLLLQLQPAERYMDSSTESAGTISLFL